jgi:very-short-patch-repair endonuclease
VVKDKIRTLARNLRHYQTEWEGRLWGYLRDRRLGGFKFRRQHPVGNYILDFYCPKKKLAVEVDGSQHGLDEQLTRDQKRTADLEKKGIRVLRYWDVDLSQNLDGVLNDILAELENRDGESVN